jgi:hypothetical protein
MNFWQFFFYFSTMKKILLFAFSSLLSLGLVAQGNPELLTYPIELKYFKAEKKEQEVTLHWLAPCQVSEATFDIQHSTDGKQFVTLFSITADQVRCTQPFQFTDPVLRNGQHFYRIRMTPLSNQSIHSFIVSVLNEGGGFALNALLPSVVQNSALLHLSSGGKDYLEIRITDLSGKNYLQQKTEVVKGVNQLSLQLGFLPRGAYLLTATNSKQETKLIRFTRQ